MNAIQTLNTLLTDLNQGQPATAQAACNLVRCLLAAGGLAVIQVIIEHRGAGETFTYLTVITMICVPLVLVERSKGMVWRRKRAD